MIRKSTANEIDAAISVRFFEAIDYLKAADVIGGLSVFCARYGLNRRNVMAQRRDPHRQIIKTSWLAHLVEDYGISPLWLLTGEGPITVMTDEKRAKNVQRIQALLLEL